MNRPGGDMQRRGKSGQKRQRATRPKARKALTARVSAANLQEKLDQRTRERDEALGQLAATSEVLKVISGSPGELQPVFDAMLANATRICEAKFGMLYLREGADFRAAATTRNAPPEYIKARKPELLLHPPPDGPLRRVTATKQVVQIADLSKLQSYLERHPFTVAAVELGRFRTALGVPMLQDGEVVGSITILRQEVRPFTDKQIELVQNFAAQAVIAVENARLLSELRESLQQQTATADVLKVISRSTFDLQTVLDTLVESAARLCDADSASIHRTRDEAYPCIASYGLSPEFQRYLRDHPIARGRGSVLGRVVSEGRTIHVPDVLADAEHALVEQRKLGGYRTVLGVPLRREGDVIGVIRLTRNKVQPFTDKQIELVTTFADQAVIAIENVRLFDEVQARTRDLSESLEQQTATSEVLKVISSSPGELEPVFNAMLANATRICEATFGNLFLREGSSIFRAVAVHSKESYVDFWRRDPIVDLRDHPGVPLDRVTKTKQVVHVPDLRTDPSYAANDTRIVPLVEDVGARTFVMVPMLKEAEIIGTIAMYRQEMRPFTEKQVELLTNFAAQAVIAIENTRLLNELRQRTDDLSESLEQQTATSEVLKVISSTQGELKPVFDAMLANATRICDATFGNLVLIQDDIPKVVAMHGAPRAFQELRRDDPRVQHGSPVWDVIKNKSMVHIPDVAATESYASAAIATHAGARTFLGVPMLKGTNLVGTISIYRQEVRPFTEKQIELVKNFAAQAVIAIDNARLLNELRQRTDDLSESLEQQTATSDVLKVISSSTGQLEPVFRTMLANATRLCEATFGSLLLTENNAFRRVAIHNAPLMFAEFHKRNPVIQPQGIPDLMLLIETKRPVCVADAAVTDTDSPIVKYGGARTLLVVPMLKDDELIGAIAIYRQEVRPFTEKQIELVANFAAQAVIAIENTRLLSELRESLQQQTATADVLKVISSSPGDLKPVFNAMLENAVRICDAKFGHLWLREDDALRIGATHGAPDAFAAYLREEPVFRPKAETGLGQLLRKKQLFHLADITSLPTYGDKLREATIKLAGARSLIGVPMIKENEVIGSIVIYRQEVRPFTDKQIELVENFAAQAVIAIENTRLLNELRESLQQQTATADVLKVISRSTFDLQKVLDTLVESAARLCEADMASINREKGTAYQQVASYGQPPELQAYMATHPIPAGHGSVVGRTVMQGGIVHISDVLADPDFKMTGAAKVGGIRTMLGVPLLREGTPIGVIVLQRKAVRPFTDKQIELVETFADQAVIAIENTRLLGELRESLQQQTATADVLKVISSSPGELEPVFQAMLERATQLCEAKFGVMFRFSDGVFCATSWLGNPPAHIIEQPHVVSENPHNLLTRIVATKQPVHSSDLTKERAYIEGNPRYVALVEAVGARSLLVVPMVKNEELIGAIAIYWQEARSFTEKQMELVSNFAAQAVIAIDNARLLSELRESLQQQTATADVLKVISRSTFNLKAVLGTLVESATRLCEADIGHIARPSEGGVFKMEAHHALSTEHIDHLLRVEFKAGRGSAVGRALLEGATVHLHDVQSDPEYDTTLGHGYRTLLGVPLMREGTPIGVFALARCSVRPFTDAQIALVSTFANQAVIAIENVRLFESVETRTRELAKSLEDLRTTQDRLVQTQKLASLGQLTAGIAHEIKNPLNFVNNFSGVSTELIDELQDALKGLPIDQKARAEITELSDTLRGNLDKVVQHGKRADAIVKNMLLHSREGSGEHRPVDINAIVEESLNLAYHGARAERQGFNITLERSLDPTAGEVDVFPQDITRVLLNLISNGFYAATKRKTQADHDGYEPTLSASTCSLGDQVEIRIRDNGTGIPPEVKEKMFNPFFTTKPAGEGTGLGLSISHDIIVKQHGGSIDVDTKPGAYTEFRIVLPRRSATLGKTGGLG